MNRREINFKPQVASVISTPAKSVVSREKSPGADRDRTDSRSIRSPTIAASLDQIDFFGLVHLDDVLEIRELVLAVGVEVDHVLVVAQHHLAHAGP